MFVLNIKFNIKHAHNHYMNTHIGFPQVNVKWIFCFRNAPTRYILAFWFCLIRLCDETSQDSRFKRRFFSVVEKKNLKRSDGFGYVKFSSQPQKGEGYSIFFFKHKHIKISQLSPSLGTWTYYNKNTVKLESDVIFKLRFHSRAARFMLCSQSAHNSRDWTYLVRIQKHVQQ